MANLMERVDADADADAYDASGGDLPKALHWFQTEQLSPMTIVCWRTWLMWLGVRVGGRGAWDAAGPPQPKGVTQILETA